MDIAYKMGIPTPRVLAYGAAGAHSPFASILMTRVPGKTLLEVHESGSLSSREMETIKAELSTYIDMMRDYDSPWGSRVCSVAGGAVDGARVPGSRTGPHENVAAFYNAFLACANPDYWRYSRSYDEALSTAKMLNATHYDLKFTHGDLLSHNIMIADGHISGILDWEFAGWLPEYWEFTSMLRSPAREGWWPDFVFSLPGYRYTEELERSRAMWLLAEDSFSW